MNFCKAITKMTNGGCYKKAGEITFSPVNDGTFETALAEKKNPDIFCFLKHFLANESVNKILP